MARKIENPLRQGLPSKIYWYAYAKPIKGYRIAKVIQKPKRRPEPSKIYPWLEKMHLKSLLIKTDGNYQSNPEPLVTQIEEQLKTRLAIQDPLIAQKPPLTDDDKARLLKLLQHDFFKDIIAAVIEKEPKTYKPRDIDAVQEICYILAVACIPQYQMLRATEKQVKKMAKEEKTTYIGYVEQPLKEPTTQDPVSQFMYYLSPSLIFKLVKLLPADLGQIWDSMEESIEKNNAEVEKPRA